MSLGGHYWKLEIGQLFLWMREKKSCSIIRVNAKTAFCLWGAAVSLCSNGCVSRSCNKSKWFCHIVRNILLSFNSKRSIFRHSYLRESDKILDGHCFPKNRPNTSTWLNKMCLCKAFIGELRCTKWYFYKGPRAAKSFFKASHCSFQVNETPTTDMLQ